MKFILPFLGSFIALAVAQSQAPSASNNNFLGSTPAERHIVNQTLALSIINAAAQESANIAIPCCISVVNPAGQLVAFLQTDNSVTVSIEVSMKKAKTVTLFNGQFTSADLYNLTQPGGSLFGIEQTNGGLVVFGGGLPLYVDGFFIGAVGVSGGTVDQDVQIATAGVNAAGGFLASSNSTQMRRRS